MNIQDIDRWRLFLALKDASDFIWDWGHRLNPKFHRPLAVTRYEEEPGFDMDLNDPAIQAFFRVVGFPSEPRELSINDLATKMNFWSKQQAKTYIHGFCGTAECTQLLQAKNSSAWRHLDAFMSVACGVTATRFYETSPTLFLDGEAGGSDCYRIKVGPSDYSLHEWFAASSTLRGVVDLLRKVLSEGLLDKFFKSADASDPKAHIRIYLDDALLLNIPVLGGENFRPCWEIAEVVGKNLDLIRCLAGLAPEETISRLKGNVLEADLGL